MSIKQFKHLGYQVRKQKYLKERKELLDKYLAMPQPLSANLVNKLEKE